MSGSPDEGQRLDARAAAARIDQAGQVVASSRRWNAGSMLLLGCATIAYYALIAGQAHHPGKGPGPLGPILIVAPCVVVMILLGIRRKHPPTAGRALLSVERTFGNVYILTLLPAGILAELIPYPLPAVLMGLIPAAPCLLGAWRAARR